ncbi:hypothetical protein BH11GEM1_BH11GEM1_36130 [soil metagenome]
MQKNFVGDAARSVTVAVHPVTCTEHTTGYGRW